MNLEANFELYSTASDVEPARPTDGFYPTFSSAKAEHEGGLKIFFTKETTSLYYWHPCRRQYYGRGAAYNY